MMKEKVYQVISHVMNVPIDNINDESSPETIEGWDSLKHMNLILALEEELGVHFTDEQIVESLSVRQIIKMIGEVGNLQSE